MAAANIARDKPRRISPPTIRGEANTPLMIILHASVGIRVAAGIVPARRARTSNESGAGVRSVHVT
jgi:hypothetical protein